MILSVVSYKKKLNLLEICIAPASLGYPDLFGWEGKVWALSCANRLTLECWNLTAGLRWLIIGRVQQLSSALNNLVFGVHRPMLPPSIKIVRKLVELTEQILLIMLCGYC